MQLHIGTKQVTAKPMTRQAYNDCLADDWMIVE